jgi:hypothetical protein
VGLTVVDDDLAVPASTFADAFLGPLDRRRGRQRRSRQRSPAAYVGRLRARHGAKLKLPDALVVATAEVVGASHLLATDRGWPDRRSLGFSGQVVRV